jgi:hypothetical protein
MRIAAFFLVVCAVALVGCKAGSRSGSVPITDVTKTNALILVSDYSGVAGDVPSGIALHVQGRLDGTAYVYAGNWETTRLSGVVNWRIYHDWFQTNCVLHYVPVSVQSGELTVDYTIR